MESVNLIFNALLVIVGASAAIIYLHQKSTEKKTAATLIVNQIDHLESVVNQLKKPEYAGTLGLYKLPSLMEDNYWEKYRVLFIHKLSSAQTKLLDDYYNNIIEIQKGATSVKSALFYAWQYKSFAEQFNLAQFVKDCANTITKNAEEKKRAEEERSYIEAMNYFIKSFEPIENIFTSNLAAQVYENNLNTYQSIRGSEVYKYLDKKSYRK